MSQGTETCGNHQNANASGEEINVRNDVKEVGLMFIILRMMMVSSFFCMPWHYFCFIREELVIFLVCSTQNGHDVPPMFAAKSFQLPGLVSSLRVRILIILMNNMY